MKDNLIDEEKAKEEEAAQETLEQKVNRLGMYKLEKVKNSDILLKPFYYIIKLKLKKIYIIVQSNIPRESILSA